jgi:C1A family cysteine protease
MTGIRRHRLSTAAIVLTLLVPCGPVCLAAAPQAPRAQWTATIERARDASTRPAQVDLAGGAVSLRSAGVTVETNADQVLLVGSESTDQLRTALFTSLTGLADFLGGPVDLSITVPTGNPRLTLRLQARTTTGYHWTLLAAGGDAGVSSFGESTRVPMSRGIGTPSVQTLTVEPLPDRPTTIRLRYGRSFGTSAPTHATLAVTLPEATATFDLTNPSAAGSEALAVDSAVFSGAGTTFTETLDATTLPSSLDWRTSGIVPAVRDQGPCGACWAFGTVGVMESALKRAGGPLTDISEQFLVSCNTDSWSCDGGWTASAYHYDTLGRSQAVVGAVLESAMPYSASNGTCTVVLDHPYKLAAWKFIAGNDTTMPSVAAIKTAIYNYGPVTAGVCADRGWDSYSGGVYRPTSNGCRGGTDHQIEIVGWDDGTTSWIVRNSWGPDWGEAGYIRIAWDTTGKTSRVGEGTSWAMVMPASPSFADRPLVAASTTIRAVHVSELRTAIDTLRLKYGLEAMSWTDPSLSGGSITVAAAHIAELRTALGAAYLAAGRSVPSYANPTLVARSSVVKAVDIAELRAAVLALW